MNYSVSTRCKRQILSTGILFASLSGLAGGAEPVTTPKPNVSAVEQIVHDYILAHPDVVLESVRAFAARAEAAEQQRKRETIKAHLPALHADSPTVETAGASSQTVTVVEFFDYRCGYCKKAEGAIAGLRKMPGVRVVYKDLPILGPDSMLAAQAALAAGKQNKYQSLHDALLATQGPLTQETIDRIATETGLNVAQLKRDMASPDIKAAIDRNLALAEKLGVQATPTFIVGQQLVSGAMEPQALAALIEKARQESTTPAAQASGGSH